MTIGLILILFLVALRIALIIKPLNSFYKQFIYGIVIPYIGILNVWFVHVLHTGFEWERLLSMYIHYPDFVISSLLLVIFLLSSFYSVYQANKHTTKFVKSLVSLPHKRNGRVIVLEFERPLAFNVGFLNPTIVLSRGVFRLEKDVRNLIIEHEIQHIRSKDNLKILLFKILLPTKHEMNLLKAHLEVLNDINLSRKFSKRTFVKAFKGILSFKEGNYTGMSDNMDFRLRFILKGERYGGMKILDVIIAIMLIFITVFLSMLNCPG